MEELVASCSRYSDITISATGLSALIRVYKCSIPFTNIQSDGLFIAELTSKTVLINVSKLLGKVMHIEIGDKLYICTLVNTFEKD